jgi:hypothetical protein
MSEKSTLQEQIDSYAAKQMPKAGSSVETGNNPSKHRIELPRKAAGLLLAAAVTFSGGAIMKNKIGDMVHDGQVNTMLSQPFAEAESNVIVDQARASGGILKPNEVTTLTVNESGFTSNVAKDIARDDIDARAVQDIMVDQIGETAEQGEQVIIQTENIDPKILQPQQGVQQPK